MTQIVDQYGNKFDAKTLAEPQTARSISLKREFNEHLSRGLTPARLVRILEEAELGQLWAQAELFEDMEEKDAHIYAELSKRKRAILSLDWSFVAPKNSSAKEEAAVQLVQELIADIPDMEDVFLNMGDAIGKGYSCFEIEWHQIDGFWVPKSIQHRPASWFTVAIEARDTLRLRDPSNIEGVPLQPFGWMVHIHKAKSGYLARAGLHRVLALPFLFKNYSVRDLAELLEIYGLPLRLGKYPRHATEDEKTALLRAVVEMGHHAAGIIPEGMAVEFIENNKASSDPFANMTDWCERSESKAILGGTLTSQADGKTSTNALGNVHNEVRLDLRNADVTQYQSTLTRDLIYPLLALNTDLPIQLLRRFRFSFDTSDSEDLELLANSLPKLADAGLPIPVSYVQKALKIPAPVDGEPILKTSGMPAVTTALTTYEPGEKTTTDVVKQYATQLREKLRPELDQWLREIRSVVMTAPSLPAAKKELLKLYPKLDKTQFAAIMQQARLASELAGRYELMQEIEKVKE